MAFLKLGNAQSDLYENYEKMNTTAIDRQANYAIDTVRLNLASDKSDKTGKYMNPASYDRAISSLQALLQKPMSKAKKQDILTMIENYQVAKNSLQASIDKAGEGNKKSVAQTLDEIKMQRQREVDTNKAALLGVAKSPTDYARQMANIILFKDEDGNLDGTLMDVDRAIDAAKADKGFVPSELLQYRDELVKEKNKWLKVSEDPKIREQYGIFVKPNAYGEWDSIDLVEINEAPKSGFRPVADANIDGLQVYFQQIGDEDADGNVYTYLPDGTKVKASSNDKMWEAKGYGGTQLIGEKALDYHPQKGDIVRVNGKDLYVYGGLNGQSDKMQHITTPEIMTQFGLWDRMNKQGGPRRDFTKDEFAQYADLVGEPITKDYITNSYRQNLVKALQEESEAIKNFEATTMFPSPVRPSTEFLTTPHTFKDVKEAAGKVVKDTASLPGSILTEKATGNEKFVQGAKEIFRSVPAAVSKGWNWVKGTFTKGAIE